MVYEPAGKYNPILPWPEYPWLITFAPVSVFTILKSTVDKMPPVISTVPERYAVGTPLGIVKGIEVVPSAEYYTYSLQGSGFVVRRHLKWLVVRLLWLSPIYVKNLLLYNFYSPTTKWTIFYLIISNHYIVFSTYSHHASFMSKWARGSQNAVSYHIPHARATSLYHVLHVIHNCLWRYFSLISRAAQSLSFDLSQA